MLHCACVLNRFSCACFFVTLWTVAHQPPLSLGFSKQEYWSENDSSERRAGSRLACSGIQVSDLNEGTNRMRKRGTGGEWF